MESCDANSSLYQSKYWCPGTLEICEEFENYRVVSLGKSPSYVSLVSCSLSVLGSLLIVFSYWKWKDIRTGSRSIVTYLAIADFFTAAGYIVAGVNYLQHYGQAEATPECVTFQQICEMQSFITTWSSMSSFAWTSILAIYLYLTIVRQRNDLAACLIPIGHVVAWVLPFFIVYPLLCTGHLGYSQVATSNWCYVSGKFDAGNEQLVDFHGRIPLDITLLVLVAGKFWEVLTIVIVLVFYSIIKCHLHREAKTGTFLSVRLVQTTRQVDRRLTFIPILFILLRMWGTIQFFYSLIVSKWMKCGCVPDGIWTGFFILGIVQSVGDGGQGWGNALLYIIGSPVLRGRMWRGLKCCLFPWKHYNQDTSNHGNRTPMRSPRFSPANRSQHNVQRSTGTMDILQRHWHQPREESPLSFKAFDGGRLSFWSYGKASFTPSSWKPSSRESEIENEPTTDLTSST